MTTFTTYNATEAITWQRVGGIARPIKVERDIMAVPKPPKPTPAIHRAPLSPTPPAKCVACPTCKATACEPCRSPGGFKLSAARSHPDRIAPRVCPCGGPLSKGCTYCDRCAIKALRISRRDYNRRQRAIARKEAA